MMTTMTDDLTMACARGSFAHDASTPFMALFSLMYAGVPSRRRSVCPGALPSEVEPPVGSVQGREGDASAR